MSKTHLQAAHEYGVAQALKQAGYASTEEVIKEAKALGLLKAAENYGGLGGALGGPIGAAIGADSGQRMSAAGGSLLGGYGGSLAGGAAGVGLGQIAALLSQGKIDPATARALGGLAGASLGGLAGSAYGGHHGGQPAE